MKSDSALGELLFFLPFDMLNAEENEVILVEKEKYNYTQNRELSWLRFNHRVLEEAQDLDVPLLERMKFVSIFTSNLDEFFMIRVGSLYDMVMLGDRSVDERSGMTAKEQLDEIYAAVAPLYRERDLIYAAIKKELHPYGVCGLSYQELEAEEKRYIRNYFQEQIMPVLSPQIVDEHHPFPHFINKEIYVIAKLKCEGSIKVGIVPVPHFVSDIVYLPGETIRYIRMEHVLMEYLELVFEQYEVSEKNYVCVTRNADISPDDETFDIYQDFRERMQKTLHKRRRLAAVRLEVANPLSLEMEVYLCEKFKLSSSQVFRTKAPMKLDYIFSIIAKLPEDMKASLVYPPFAPQVSAAVQEGSMMKQIRKKDIMLCYPYESMEPFLQLMREAALDPNVLTIKITIYRLAKQTRLVEYLCAAAENGKEVTVLIELRARFDEQNNIDWSQRLEAAGCKVIYGFDDYKVHSKLCQIRYRNRNEIETITQVGTGNYNEKTAAMYTDICFMTANPDIGKDTSSFFENMLIGNVMGEYEHLLVAPINLKKRILELIDEEIQKGSAGRIIMKMNSVTDIDFIHKMEEASRAGVKIDLIVRGICCILPNIATHTENLNVTSIVGRYLEHMRIFSFGTGAEQKMYIGSADMMTRNTEKRVEVACPIYDPVMKANLNHILELQLADNVKARMMMSNGSYAKKEQIGEAITAQELFMQEALCANNIEKRNHEWENQSLLQKSLVWLKNLPRH